MLALVNCSPRVHSHITGPPGFEQAEHAEILAEHLLFAAEAAADAFGEHVQIARVQPEQIRELRLRDERRLRAGAHVDAAVVALPGQRLVAFEMHVLHAADRIGALVNGVGFLEARLHAADLAVNVDVHVGLGPHPARLAAAVVQHRRGGFHRLLRIEHRRQELVVHFDQPARFLGGAFGFGDDRGETLAHEAHDVVENVRVVGVDEVILVQRGGVQPARNVFPGVHAGHTGHGQRLVLADRRDARVRVRRAQDFEVQRAFGRRDVEGVAGRSGDDRRAERVAQARAGRFAGDVFLGFADAVDGIVDAAVAGAPAQVAFEMVREIGLRRIVERAGRQDHAGRAVAALETARVEEVLLHRMELAVLRQPFDRRDLTVRAAKRGHETAMEWFAVDQHRARAAIARVAAFLDAVPAEIAQKGAQALAGLGLGREFLAVDGVVHLAANSARIDSA